mmetsp:Transcript_11502/g.53479  ORF Transcript_11502/g.53479 Transcript_11502/m.53479 type:complete len:558 (-) Transcript_11502:175-1848(-)
MCMIILWMFKIVLDGDFTSSTVQKYLDHGCNIHRESREGRNDDLLFSPWNQFDKLLHISSAVEVIAHHVGREHAVDPFRVPHGPLVQQRLRRRGRLLPAELTRLQHRRRLRDGRVVRLDNRLHPHERPAGDETPLRLDVVAQLRCKLREDVTQDPGRRVLVHHTLEEPQRAAIFNHRLDARLAPIPERLVRPRARVRVRQALQRAALRQRRRALLPVPRHAPDRPRRRRRRVSVRRRVQRLNQTPTPVHAHNRHRQRRLVVRDVPQRLRREHTPLIPAVVRQALHQSRDATVRRHLLREIRRLARDFPQQRRRALAHVCILIIRHRRHRVHHRARLRHHRREVLAVLGHASQRRERHGPGALRGAEAAGSGGHRRVPRESSHARGGVAREHDASRHGRPVVAARVEEPRDGEAHREGRVRVGRGDGHELEAVAGAVVEDGSSLSLPRARDGGEASRGSLLGVGVEGAEELAQGRECTLRDHGRRVLRPLLRERLQRGATGDGDRGFSMGERGDDFFQSVGVRDLLARRVGVLRQRPHRGERGDLDAGVGILHEGRVE